MQNTEKLIQLLLQHNPHKFNILKLAEELSELSDCLIKLITKPQGYESRLEHLAEEFADVALRGDVVINMLNLQNLVDNKINLKVEKLTNKIIANQYATY